MLVGQSPCPSKESWQLGGGSCELAALFADVVSAGTPLLSLSLSSHLDPPFDDFTRLRLPPISTPVRTSLGPRTLPPSNSAGAERHFTLPKMGEAEAAI